MRKWIWLAIFVGMSLPGCGGTETGNPGSADAVGVPSTAVVHIDLALGDVCRALSKCFSSADKTQCYSTVTADNSLVTSFGLDPGTYPTIASVESAELSGTLAPSSSAFSACESDLAALSCSQITASGAYSPSAAADYSHIGAMIPAAATSCHGLYSH